MGRKPGTPKTPGSGRDFRPGPEWTGNAGGRPKRKPFTAAYQKFADTPRKKLEALDDGKLTGAQATALAVMKESWRGKIPAAQESADRAEGKVKQEVEMLGEGGVEAASARILSLMKRAEERAKRDSGK